MQFHLLRYVITYVFAVLALTLITFLLEFVVGISLPTGAATILPVMMAAMLEGQRHARETGQPVESKDAWMFAFRASGLVVLFSVVIAVLVTLVLSEFPSYLAVFGPTGWIAILAVGFVVVLLTNRFSLTLGVRNELKAQDRRKP